MASTTPPAPSSPLSSNGRRRGASVSSVAHSVASTSQSAVEYTKDLVMHQDPPLGFMAATAAATSRAPSVKEIRSGEFGQEGWNSRSGSLRSSRRRSSGSREHPQVVRDSRAFLEPFAPLTEEESTRLSSEIERKRFAAAITQDRTQPSTTPFHIPASSSLTTSQDQQQPTNQDRTPLALHESQRVHTSGYIPPPQLPWTTSTAIALKAFGHWFLTWPGFLITLYGLNVVAWGGMLFLLLCGAAPAMCWAPVPNAENHRHMTPAAALSLPGPYYHNCNDINSPRRIWIEIDSQILNALFCVTGFGLAPWRFRDLYYILRYRLTSARRQGIEAKLYGLRVLAGIHNGWFRLPDSQTLDSLPAAEYLATLHKTHPSSAHAPDLEPQNAASDPRTPLPPAKSPAPPLTSIRASPTPPWKMDFFIWCAVWNTFFQCCLCGFMWGMDRYARPPWSTGLFVALACIIAAVGGVVGFVEGKRVKKVEGVGGTVEEDAEEGLGSELREVRTGGTGWESVHVGEGKKGRGDRG